MCVGQAIVQGASKQKRQRAASTAAWRGGHARRNFREILFVLLGRKLGSCFAQRHELAVVSLAGKRRHSSIRDWGKCRRIREDVASNRNGQVTKNR